MVEAEEPGKPSITCPVCGTTSFNPNDIREGYCGNCHDWTGQCDPSKKYHVTPHRGCVLR